MRWNFDNLFAYKPKVPAERKVFCFGESGSAKSTVCAMLAHYAFHERRYGATLPTDTTELITSSRVIEAWLEHLKDGRFPLKTDPKKWQQVKLNVIDKHEDTAYAVTYLEAAGEDLVRGNPAHPQYELTGLVESWLSESQRILLVGPCNPAPSEAWRLTAFANFLRDKRSKDSCLSFVVTKMDKVGGAKPDKLATVINTQYRELANTLDVLKDEIPISIFGFSVGRLDANDVIVDINPEVGCRQLLEWVLKGR